MAQPGRRSSHVRPGGGRARSLMESTVPAADPAVLSQELPAFIAARGELPGFDALYPDAAIPPLTREELAADGLTLIVGGTGFRYVRRLFGFGWRRL